MGMFFNSWKDDDAEYYYGTISDTGSSNYSRGYDDGYYSGKKAVSDRYDKGYDKGYNEGFKAGLNLYFQKKEPLKKDALELLMDELELNELSKSIELETFDVQDSSESEICSEPDYDKPESVQFDECEIDCETDSVVDMEPQRDSLL